MNTPDILLNIARDLVMQIEIVEALIAGDLAVNGPQVSTHLCDMLSHLDNALAHAEASLKLINAK